MDRLTADLPRASVADLAAVTWFQMLSEVEAAKKEEEAEDKRKGAGRHWSDVRAVSGTGSRWSACDERGHAMETETITTQGENAFLAGVGVRSALDSAETALSMALGFGVPVSNLNPGSGMFHPKVYLARRGSA